MAHTIQLNDIVDTNYRSILTSGGTKENKNKTLYIHSYIGNTGIVYTNYIIEVSQQYIDSSQDLKKIITVYNSL